MDSVNTHVWKQTISCGTCTWKVDKETGKVQVLLIRPKVARDSWGIPKGHVDPGEDNRTCAVRETREEAGVDVVLGEEVGTAQVHYRDEHKTVICYLAQQVGEKEAVPDDPDGEVADVRWFYVDDLPKVHVYQRPLISLAVTMIEAKIS